MRKKARRPVYYVSAAFRDGAVVACMPARKPSTKRIKQDGVRIDSDLVFRESYYAPSQFPGWNQELRIRTADLLANRMNMRRTVRDLVLPKLVGIETTLIALQKQLERLEQEIASPTSRPSQSSPII